MMPPAKCGDCGHLPTEHATYDDGEGDRFTVCNATPNDGTFTCDCTTEPVGIEEEGGTP